MDCAAAAVAFVKTASDIAKASHKCYKAVKRIQHVHEDIHRYANSAEEFRHLVGMTGETIETMIDSHLPVLEGHNFKELILKIHSLAAREHKAVNEMCRRLRALGKDLNGKKRVSKFICGLKCYQELKVIRVAICRFEPAKTSISTFASLMSLNLSIHEHQNCPKDDNKSRHQLELIM